MNLGSEVNIEQHQVYILEAENGSWRAMNRCLLPKARLGAAHYWPPLENRVSNFKLTVLSRQEEFLSGTGTVGKLRCSSFTFYVWFTCQTHFDGCKFEKGVARMSRKCSNYGSGIHNLRYFGIFRIHNFPGSHEIFEIMTVTPWRWLILKHTPLLRLLTNLEAN